MKDVSIIVPVRNGEATLARCLGSLLGTAIAPLTLELLLIDDGSTDRTEEICRTFAARYPESLRYFRFRENRGVSAARNLGIAKSTGRFLAFVDSDDTVSPSCIYKMVQAMEAGVDLVCTGYYAVKGKLRHPQKFFPRSCLLKTGEELEEFYLRLLDDDYGQPPGNWRVTAIGVPWGKLFRADRVRQLRLHFPERLRRSEDNLFVTAYITGCAGIRYLDLPLYGYHVEHSKEAYDEYPPGVYRRIQKERDRFFKMSSLKMSPTLRSFRCSEKAVMQNAAAKYLVLHYPRKIAVRGMRYLASLKEFHFPIKEVCPWRVGRKQRFYLFLSLLLRLRLCGMVDLIWRIVFLLREQRGHER